MLSVLPDAVVTTLDTSVTIHVLANDSGSGLTITSFSNPAHGSVIFNADQSFTYAPTMGFVGTDSFAYTVRDAQGTPSGAEVTITVAPNDGATRATDDYIEMIAGGNAIIPVLSNDLTATGSLRLIAISVPGHGAANVLADQSIRYVPQSGFVGIDSFTYTVIDQAGTTTSAIVTVKVLAENRPPLAKSDAFTLEAGQTTVLAILGNDSDPDGDPLQVVSYTMPSHGSLAFNPDKMFSYTPNAGYQGADQFTYTIRDNRGASASASVLLTIAETAEQPTATDDHVVTEAGMPAVIDVLGNDGLPVGQEIRIVAVTLPFKGKIVFNLDGTITYTPNMGFVGFDDFTYTIGNGLGGTAKATVTIEVTPVAETSTYANGYGYRRRIALPASAAKGATHTGFPLRVALAGEWLKTVAAGGKVASPEGHDLRFESENSTVLPHEIERYDDTAGSLDAWVRLAELSTEHTTLLSLYYGKAGMSHGDARPAEVWQDYLAIWHLPAHSDISGNERGLVPSGGTASSSEGIGAGALVLDGNGLLRLDDTTWLNGLTALSVQFRSRADSIGHDQGQINVGGFGSDANSFLAVRYQAIGFAGTQPANVIHSKVRTTAGNAGISSPAGVQTTQWQNITFEWASGDPRPALYLNGEALAASYVNQIEGPATTEITGPLYLGAGPKNGETGGWSGLLDEVRFSARKLGGARIAAEHANLDDPTRVYGVGDEETVEDAPAIVAVPFHIEIVAGQWTDIDVLGAAVAAVPGETTIGIVEHPSGGMVSVINNKIRYTSTAGYVGIDSFVYSLSRNGKTTRALVVADIESGISEGQTGGADELPEALRVVTVRTQSELDAAKGSAKSGDHIVLEDGSYNLGHLTRSGTSSDPIVFRARNKQGAKLTSLGDVSGNHVRLWGFDCGNTGFSELTGEDFWIIRCVWSGSYSGMRARVKAPEFHAWYCEMSGNGRQIAFDTAADAGGSGKMGINGYVKGCWFHDVAPGGANATETITVGFANTRTFVESNTLIEDCLFEDCNLGGAEDETIAIKSSKVTVSNCTFRRTRFCQIRHGTGNLIERCIHLDSPTGGLSIFDGSSAAYNVIASCRTANGSQVRIYCGNNRAAGDDAAWWQDAGAAQPRAYRAGIYHMDCVNDAGIIGYTFSTPPNPTWPAYQTQWLENRGLPPTLMGSVTGGARQVDTSTSGAAPLAYLPPIALSRSSVGVDATL